MKKILLFTKYNLRHDTPFVELHLCDDGSGSIVGENGKVVYVFDDLRDLRKILNKMI